MNFSIPWIFILYHMSLNHPNRIRFEWHAIKLSKSHVTVEKFNFLNTNHHLTIRLSSHFRVRKNFILKNWRELFSLLLLFAVKRNSSTYTLHTHTYTHPMDYGTKQVFKSRTVKCAAHASIDITQSLFA